jgi:anti-sigma factor RsiW
MSDEEQTFESLPDIMTWEMLNAYVDQELDPRRAALVADAVARDHGLAARVATLSKLRATAREMPPASDAPRPLALRTLAGFRSRRVIAVAASILLAVVLASTLLWRGPLEENASKEAADAIHREWLAGQSLLPKDAPIEFALASRFVGTLPDLSAANLRVVFLSAEPVVQGHGIFGGYVGPHGCRLGLSITPSRGGDTAIRASQDSGGILIRAWRSDGAEYALMSHSMDPDRLDRLALIVAELVRQRGPATDEQRIALRATETVGRACAA